MKKYILGAVLSIGLLFSPAFTQAAGLTTTQINAIISLLSSFGADQSVINRVSITLNHGSTNTTTVPGCAARAVFSSTTGNDCGCPIGAVFSSMTGNACDGTTTTPTITTNPTAVVTSGPSLALNYDSNNKEASLTASATVTITAENTDLFVVNPTKTYPANVTTNICSLGITEVDTQGHQMGSATTITTSTAIDNGSYWVIPEGMSAQFLIVGDVNSVMLKQMFAGSYHAVPMVSCIVNNQGSSNIASSKDGNYVTIIGETAPYIIGVYDNRGSVADTYTMEGNRFDLVSNKVTINGITKVLPSNGNNQGGIIYFKLADFGITQNGSYNAQVSTGEGASNNISFVSNGNTTSTSLTSTQIQSILSLLSSFGASSAAIANVKTILNGGTVPTSNLAPSNLSSSQIQSILSLLSAFGANSTMIANVGTVLTVASPVQAPTITSLSPSSGLVGTTVTVYASGLDQTMKLYFGGTSTFNGYTVSASFNNTTATPTSMSFIIPSTVGSSQVLPGSYNIQVANSSYNGLSNLVPFTVTSATNPAPTGIWTAPTCPTSCGQSASNPAYTCVGGNGSCATNSPATRACGATAACVGPSVSNAKPTGSIDSITSGGTTSCGLIGGWAFDSDSPATATAIHVYVDNAAGVRTGYDTGVTNAVRTDVNNAFGIAGAHGYNYQIPNLTAGNYTALVYAIGVDRAGNQVGSENTLLNSNAVPMSFSCAASTATPTGTWIYSTSCPTACGTAQSTQTQACTYGNSCSGFAASRTCNATQACAVSAGISNNKPTGVIDIVSSGAVGTCGMAAGWAYDADNVSANTEINLYVDGQAGSGTGYNAGATNALRQDVNNAFGITGTHGYSYQIPNLTAGSHTVYAYSHGVDTAGNNINTEPVLLVNSPMTFVCNPAPLSLTGGSNQMANALGALNSATPTNATQPATNPGFSYSWNNNLEIGSSYTADVSALQTALTHEGLYAGEITGGFYSQTFSAVKAFQQKYGIDTGTNGAGFVGSKTRAKLNTLY